MICRFHVNLPGCIFTEHFGSRVSIEPLSHQDPERHFIFRSFLGSGKISQITRWLNVSVCQPADPRKKMRIERSAQLHTSPCLSTKRGEFGIQEVPKPNLQEL